MSNIATEPREMLKEIVSRTGEEILRDSDRCESLLKDHCGPHRKEIAALVGALEERVPLELKSSWQSAMTPEAMRSRLVQRMQDNRGLAPDLADWAVDTWSYALGVGLGRRSDRLASIVVPEPHPVPVADTNSQVVWGAAAQNAPVAEHVEPQAPQAKASPTGHQGSSQKVIGAVAAAVALYFAYTHFHQPQPIHDCPAGQTQAADGSCVAIPKPLPKPPVAKRQDPAPKTVAALAAGTLIPVTVNETLNSDTVTIGRYVNGIVTAPVIFNGKTFVPEGTRVVLQVTGVDQSGKLIGAAKIDLALVEMTIGAKKYNIASANTVVAGLLEDQADRQGRRHRGRDRDRHRLRDREGVPPYRGRMHRSRANLRRRRCPVLREQQAEAGRARTRESISLHAKSAPAIRVIRQSM